MGRSKEIILEICHNGLTPIVAAGLLIACSGGSGSVNEKNESDSGLDQTEVQEEILPAVITSEGIGLIKIGMPIDSVPESITGLYDSFSPGPDTRDIEALQYDFSKDGRVRFSALDFGEGKIDMIYITDYEITTSEDDFALRLGDDFRNLMNRVDVTAHWIPYDEMGVWAWQSEGLWYMIDPEGIGLELSQKLYDPAVAPTVRDMKDSAKIGYIGTGLPF